MFGLKKRSRQSRVTLVLPGLLDRLPAWQTTFGDLRRAPFIEGLLGAARIRRLPVHGFEATLMRAYGLGLNETAELPMGRMLDASGAPDKTYLCASPVHLQQGMTNLLLVDGSRLEITADEAEALRGHFNVHFKEAGYALNVVAPTLWRLSVPKLQAVTVPLSKVMGASVAAHLPVGPGGSVLRQLMNETQMLFFTHEVNVARERRGAAAINSLWLWGAGEDRLDRPKAAALLCSSSPIAAALAQNLQMDIYPGITKISDVLHQVEHKRIVICDDGLQAASAYDDINAWERHLSYLEHSLFETLFELVTEKAVDLEIHDCAGRSFSVSSVPPSAGAGARPLAAYSGADRE